MDDLLIRRRLERLRARGSDPAPGWPRQRFQVINGGNIPTTVPRVFWGVPVGPVIGASAPAEGGAIASAALANSEAQPIVVIGPEAPVAGRQLLAFRVNDQWVADYGLGDPGGDPGGPNNCCSTCASGVNELLWPSTLTVTGPGGGGVITGTPDAFGCRFPNWSGLIQVPCTGIKLVTATEGATTYARMPDKDACCTEQPMTSILACVQVGLACVTIGTLRYWRLSTAFMVCQECPFPPGPTGCGAHGLIALELLNLGVAFNQACDGGGASPCGEAVSTFPGVTYKTAARQTISVDYIAATSINCREPRTLSYSVLWPGSAGLATVTVSP